MARATAARSGRPRAAGGCDGAGLQGLYLHIPFCAALCNYCDFNRGLIDGPLKRRYVAALAREIRRIPDRPAADTIYFGGGTPSLLDPGEVADLLAACREAFAVSPGAEVTLEANPETVSRETLAAFRAAGVNRLSVGVQSFRDEELRRLSRLHTAARARAAVLDARAAGFDNVSLDLMIGLPGQTLADLDTSLDALLDLAPEHASAYLLDVHPHVPLAAAIARAQWSLPSDDDVADMYLHAMARFDEAGLQQYEISNVARAGCESRHNLKYWSDGEWTGFGSGAHSTVGHVRWNNRASTGEYLQCVEAGESPATGRRDLSPGEQVEEALFMALRLTAGVSLDAVARTYGVDVWRTWGGRLAPCLEAGLLVLAGDRLRLTRRGMLLANEVMSAFLAAGSTVK